MGKRMKNPLSAWQKLDVCGIIDRRSRCNFHISVFFDKANITYLIQIFEPVDDKNVLGVKINHMKLTQQIALTGITLILYSCGSNLNRLNVVNAGSFSEKQITLEGRSDNSLIADSLRYEIEIPISNKDALLSKLDEMEAQLESIRKSESDSSWSGLTSKWEDFRNLNFKAHQPDSLSILHSSVITKKWAELNVNLLKFSEEVSFGDALEELLYQSEVPSLSEKLIKSIIYTHVDDQIFINLFYPSNLIHQHTTGGAIKLIQETTFPSINEMTLKCESNDVRYLDVFIRIPEWAVNPTVSHGNVKYVARPGEYCQISRKWKGGDEFLIKLKN